MVTVVLDIDGTLLLSVRQHQAALVRAYAHFPVPVVTGGWDRFRHHTDSGILDELFEAGVGRGVSRRNWRGWTRCSPSTSARNSREIRWRRCPVRRG